jgi:hypothetical protein
MQSDVQRLIAAISRDQDNIQILDYKHNLGSCGDIDIED